MKEDLRKWFGKGKKGDWVRVGTDGEIKGDCARDQGEGKPKCMPRSKAHSMSKKDRASAARRKRYADPNSDRPGTGNKPIMVKTDKKEMNEKNVPTNPKLWAKFKAQAKAKFDVYPSAYANGWAAKQYKAAGGGWKTESVNEMKSFKYLREKSVSQSQQKMMGMALAYKRGEMPDASPEVKKMANSMSMKDLEDFAKTKHKGLPVKKESVDLDEIGMGMIGALRKKNRKKAIKGITPKRKKNDGDKPYENQIGMGDSRSEKELGEGDALTNKWNKSVKNRIMGSKLSDGKKKDLMAKLKSSRTAADAEMIHQQLDKLGVKESVELDEAFTPKEIKMAIGVASDKRYAKGNMTGAVNAIEKIKKGLSDHPQVKAVLRRQNESLDEAGSPERLAIIKRAAQRVKDKKDAADKKAFSAAKRDMRSKGAQRGMAPLKRDLDEGRNDARKALMGLAKQGGIDKATFQKAYDLYSDTKFVELKKLIAGADTDPREAILDVINRHDSRAFNSMYPRGLSKGGLTKESTDLGEKSRSFPFQGSNDHAPKNIFQPPFGSRKNMGQITFLDKSGKEYSPTSSKNKKKVKENEELGEATDFRKGDTVHQVGSKLKGTVMHKGNRDEIVVKFGTVTKSIPASKLRLSESVELDEMNLSKQTSKQLLQFYRKYADKKMGPSDANMVKAVRRELMKRGVSIKEEVELDEASYKVPSNYAAMMAKKRKKAGTSEFGKHPDKKWTKKDHDYLKKNTSKQEPEWDGNWKEEVDLDEAKINQLTRVGWMDGDVLNIEDDDISTLQRDLKSKGYTKSSSVKKGLETHMVYTSKGKPDIFLSYDGQNDAAYVSYNKRSVFESVELDETKGSGVKKFVRGMRVQNLNGSKGTVIKGGDNMKKAVEVEWDSGQTTLASAKYLKSINKNESVELGEANKRVTLGGTSKQGNEFFMGEKGIDKMIALSKQNPKTEYTVKSDNYGNFKPHWLRNGKFAKQTVANIEFDMDRNAVRGKPKGKDVKDTIFSLTHVVKESVELGEAKISVGDRVTLQPNKNTLDRSLIGKAGVVTGMVGSKPTVKFANGKTIVVSPNDLKINESVDLDEATYMVTIDKGTFGGVKSDGRPILVKAKSVRDATTKAAKKVKIDPRLVPTGGFDVKVNNKESVEHENCGTPDCCGTCDTDIKEMNFFQFRNRINEARRDAAKDLYFDTYSAAIQKAINTTFDKNKLEVDAEDYYQKVNMGPGKPGRGKTTRHTIDLVDVKTGKPSRKKLHIQIYNRETAKNPYELNYYVS